MSISERDRLRFRFSKCCCSPCESNFARLRVYSHLLCQRFSPPNRENWYTTHYWTFQCTVQNIIYLNCRCEWTLNKKVKAEISKDTSPEEHTKELKLHTRPISASGLCKWGLCCKILNGNSIFWTLIQYDPHFSRFLPPANEVWGKVMFLHLSVSHSVHSGHRSGWYAPHGNAYLFTIWSTFFSIF